MSADTQRLFFTLWPTDPVRQRISAAGAAAVRAAGGTPVAPANYHLTLAFLGSVPVAQTDAVLDAAREVRFAPFTLVLDRTGYWPRPQVAWLKPAECPPPLAGLVADLWTALEPLGYAADSRSYKPHVSLVRKVPGGLGSLVQPPVEWRVDEFALARSDTLPAGAVYTLLERFAATA